MLPDLSKSNFRKMVWGGEQRVRARPRQPAFRSAPGWGTVQSGGGRPKRWVGCWGVWAPGKPPEVEGLVQAACSPACPAVTKAAERG